MFNQMLTPVGGGLIPSFLAAALPIVTVLIALGVLRRPAWQASLAGLAMGLVMAIVFWKLPFALALDSIGLAYLMNYSGMNYTLGLGGHFFPMPSAFLQQYVLEWMIP